MNEKRTGAERDALRRKVFARIFEQPEGATAKELARGLAELDYALLPKIHVLYLKVKGPLLPVEKVRILADSLRRDIADSIYFIADDNKSVTFLVSANRLVASASEARTKWLKSLVQAEEANGIEACIGVSSEFDDITEAQTYLRQAQKACRTGEIFKNASPVYLYDDFRIADVIASVPDKTALNSFRYPPLMRLIEHDSRKDTRYAFTLYKYLQNPEDPAEVCRQLFIHKNTLYFRLNKARQIMGCDFKKGTEILQIQFTFVLLNYEGKLEDKLQPSRTERPDELEES